MSAPLSMWTIYDHPRDYPELFVARRFEVTAEGPRPANDFNDVLLSPALEMLRYHFLILGLACLTRSPEDDPCIVETWL